jgi:hypothetical protein
MVRAAEQEGHYPISQLDFGVSDHRLFCVKLTHPRGFELR